MVYSNLGALSRGATGGTLCQLRELGPRSCAAVGLDQRCLTPQPSLRGGEAEAGGGEACGGRASEEQEGEQEGESRARCVTCEATSRLEGPPRGITQAIGGAHGTALACDPTGRPEVVRSRRRCAAAAGRQ
eukprot:2637383-Rhodomonas_salina.1